jgi:hypothetical protein
MESSHSRQDDGQDSAEEASQTEKFQFIDLSTRSKEQQAKNRTLARSHTSKVVQRKQQKAREAARKQGRVEFTFVKGHSSMDSLGSMTNLISTMRLDQKAKDHLQSRASIKQFFRSRSWTPNSGRLSQKPAIESTISALRTYKGKVTPYLHMLLGECMAFSTSTLTTLTIKNRWHRHMVSFLSPTTRRAPSSCDRLVLISTFTSCPLSCSMLHLGHVPRYLAVDVILLSYTRDKNA